MPLLPQPGCNPPSRPEGCDWLYETAVEMLHWATMGLEPFQPTPDDGCERFHSYVSMSPPAGEAMDGLSLHLVSFGPTSESTNQRNRVSGNPPGMPPVWEARWEFQLWESGYPQIDKSGEHWIYPDPKLLHEINRHVYAHGMAAYLKLSRGIDRIMTGQGMKLPPQVDKVLIQPLAPLGPSGGSTGWRWQTVTVIA